MHRLQLVDVSREIVVIARQLFVLRCERVKVGLQRLVRALHLLERIPRFVQLILQPGFGVQRCLYLPLKLFGPLLRRRELILGLVEMLHDALELLLQVIAHALLLFELRLEHGDLRCLGGDGGNLGGVGVVVLVIKGGEAVLELRDRLLVASDGLSATHDPAAVRVIDQRPIYIPRRWET